MSAIAIEKAAPAFPLGKPVDGRARYGMTPEQAILYRWLVKHKPHDAAFNPQFRTIAKLTMCSLGNAHARIAALVERGWLWKGHEGYGFVHPIMRFKAPRNG